VVLVSGRVAAWLLSRARLDEYHRVHRGDDAEVDQVVVALKLAALAWRERSVVGTDHGTRTADTPAQRAPSPDWLTTTAAARSLGIGTRAVRKAIGAGRLPATWAGGCWWIDPEDVEHFRARRAA
jgi:excisionase family DNA binding protein